MRNDHPRLLGLVMFWTTATTVLAWLPLVRIIGRPEGYTWSVLGLSGAGTQGPYGVFIAATAYVVTLLYVLQRGPRIVSHPMLLLWHLAATALVVYGTLQGGPAASLQGQGLHFEIPLWILSAPFVLFTVIVLLWVILDGRSGTMRPAPWSRPNSNRLAISLTLLGVALILFRAGTNYNWVTAAAIIITITHWIMLAVSFESRAPATTGVAQRKRQL